MSSLVVLLLRGPLIGICLGSCLYGITCLQALFYFRTYVDDRRSLKLTVALLLTLETLHVVLSMWIVDYYLVANYTNELALQSATWFTTVTYSIGFMIDLVVYSYFTWRVWKFTEKSWIVFFMLLIILTRTGGPTPSILLSAKRRRSEQHCLQYTERAEFDMVHLPRTRQRPDPCRECSFCDRGCFFSLYHGMAS